MTEPPDRNVPEALNAVVDAVLAYKPKPQSKPAKKRKENQQVSLVKKPSAKASQNRFKDIL